MQDRNYSIGSEDGKSISFREEETAFIGPTITIKFKYIIVILLIIFFTFNSENLKISDTIGTIINKFSTIISDIYYHSELPVSKDGFVFEDSSVRILTKEEILDLQNTKRSTFQRLLRMSINEMYARKGQIFNTKEVNDNYYGQYDWYRDITNKHIVKWNEFNEQEKANLRLLISIEEYYGYR